MSNTAAVGKELLQEIVVGVLVTEAMSVEQAIEKAMELDMQMRAAVAEALTSKLSKEQRKQLFGDATDATINSVIEVLNAASAAGAIDVPDGTKVRLQFLAGVWDRLVNKVNAGARKAAFRWTLALLQKAGVSDIRSGNGDLCRRDDKDRASQSSLDAVSYMTTMHPDACFSERVCLKIKGFKTAEEALGDAKFVQHLEEVGRRNDAKVREHYPNFKHGSNAGQAAATLAPDDVIARVGIHTASPLYDEFEGLPEVNGRRVVSMKAFWTALVAWNKAGGELPTDDEPTEDEDEAEDVEGDDEPTDEDLTEIEEEAAIA